MHRKVQPIYWTLQAFNIELSRTRTGISLSNPVFSSGKFAFWRDVVEGGNVRGHPIGTALQSVLREDRAILINIINYKVLSLI